MVPRENERAHPTASPQSYDLEQRVQQACLKCRCAGRAAPFSVRNQKRRGAALFILRDQIEHICVEPRLEESKTERVRVEAGVGGRGQDLVGIVGNP